MKPPFTAQTRITCLAILTLFQASLSQVDVNPDTTFRILLAGDCHPHPGPTYKYPCGDCGKPCKSNQPAVACDNCDTWFHIRCIGLPLAHYERITSNTSWICCSCGLPNFSTTLFETTMADSINTSIATENSYSVLQPPEDAPGTPSSATSATNSIYSLDSSIGSPQHSSSPRKKPSTVSKLKNTFRVLIINFQSVRAKRHPFWLLLSEADPDIVIGCETWLYNSIHEREFLPSGYHSLARRDRGKSPHGGVFIAAKENITGRDLQLITTAEITAAAIQCSGNQELIVAAVYRPPSSDFAYMCEVREKIHALHLQYPKATIWTAGDFNLPDIDWSTNAIVSNNYNLNLNQEVLDMLYDTGSEQMINFPTRGNNTLDLFITNRPSLVMKTKPIPGVSDHDIVFVEASTQAARKKLPQRKILLWRNANIDDMRSEIHKFSIDFIQKHDSTTNINNLWEAFRNFCTLLTEDKVPSKLTSSRFNQPWVNRKLKRLSRRKKRAYKRMKQNPTQTTADTYKKLQKDTQRECRKAYNMYVNDIVTSDKNPKKLYTLINGKRCESSGVPLLKKDGIGYSDPATKARIMNDQFSSVFTREDISYTPEMDTDPFPSMDSFHIDEQGVKKLLLDLDQHKAQGPDNIPTRLLKEFATEIAPALTLVFEASLQQGVVPTDWKTAFVTPVFKKGDRTVPANYRPISLTSVCCKLFEHILHSQVMKHLEQYNILTDQQHGFRKKRSCESQLVLTIQDLAEAIEDGEQIDAILLDFSKAFDKVPHGRLSAKLWHYGIRGNLLQWIESFLSSRSQQVVVEGHKSPSAPVTSGVPQGSVLGPLLFLLYINDMPGKVSSTNRLFADDSLLYRKIKSQQDANILQQDLHRLEQWETDWQMQFNPSKCETIRITRKRNPIKTVYHIHGHQLACVPNGKYLGTTIHEKLMWNDHVDATTKKANNSLAFLRRNITNCPSSIKAQCYMTLVRPIMEYASPAWDPHTSRNINKLEAVQRRAARFVTGDYRMTSSTSQMIATLGWPTLQQRRADAKLILVYRITHSLIDIPAPMYLHPAALSTRGHTYRYLVPYCRTDTYRNSFFPSAIRLWNQLPEAIATSQTLDSFKAGLGTLH